MMELQLWLCFAYRGCYGSEVFTSTGSFIGTAASDLAKLEQRVD